MKFSTKVNIEPSAVVSYTSKILTMGSCFADSIGEKMLHAGMSVLCNPFGALYNPCSIAASFDRILDGKHYCASELVERDGLWHSFAHHGRFSTADKDVTLRGVNEALDATLAALQQLDVLILTLGTAWVYERQGCVVANCHKFPDKEFIRRCMSADEVTTVLAQAITRLRTLRPNLKVIVTVSPIRHLRDGAHGNQLSKATLMLGVDALCKQIENVFYFPAYEIMMDELRDYRFYADDMLHPSALAVQYIWELFVRCMMDEESSMSIAEGEKCYRYSSHRLLH